MDRNVHAIFEFCEVVFIIYNLVLFCGYQIV